MSDGLVNSKARGKNRAGYRPKPRDGVCVGCNQRVGTSGLCEHHCHECDRFIEWLCDACNTPLTEHAIPLWGRLEDIHAHECTARLFHVRRTVVVAGRPNGVTRQLRLSNGGGDDRTVSISDTHGYFSIEQLAVAAGVNTATARDIASGRGTKSGRGIGHKVDGTWLIPFSDFIAFLEQRNDSGR